MELIHGFSFLLGAIVAWICSRKLGKSAVVGNEEWLLKEISSPTDEGIDEATEKCRIDMDRRKLSGFSPRATLEADPAGSNYLRYQRIKCLRAILKANGWQQNLAQK